MELIVALAGGLVAATVAYWNRRRTRADEDTRAIRAVTREMYRELDAGSRCMGPMRDAKTYGELLAAAPSFAAWPNARSRLADHALECIWVQLAYDMDKLLWERGELVRRLTPPASVHASDPVPAQEKEKIVRAFEEGMQKTLSILEAILPSSKPSRARVRLGQFKGSARDAEKLRDRQFVVRRELARAQSGRTPRLGREGSK